MYRVSGGTAPVGHSARFRPMMSLLSANNSRAMRRSAPVPEGRSSVRSKASWFSSSTGGPQRSEHGLQSALNGANYCVLGTVLTAGLTQFAEDCGLVNGRTSPVTNSITARAGGRSRAAHLAVCDVIEQWTSWHSTHRRVTLTRPSTFFAR